MPIAKNHLYIGVIAALIGIVLVYIRILSNSFVLGTTTFQHPYIQFSAALILGGGAAMALIYGLKNTNLSRSWLYGLLGLSLLYRALFIGSVPIYEDDWNRYLWDGASAAQGVNPYAYAPKEIIEGANSENPQIRKLNKFDSETGDITYRINYPELRTIYPPGAQVVFTAAALIDPLNLDVLRGLYILIDVLTLFLLIKTLQAYERDPKWALLYALNPLLIYSGFNVAHMDVILVPLILLTMLWVKRRAPIKAATALSLAAAVKLWPLLLAPIFFRAWRRSPVFYLGIAALTAVLSAIFNLPLLLSIGDDSGLVAYSGEWQRSSFIFPLIFAVFEPFTTAPGQISRVLVAVIVTLISLYYGFVKKADDQTLPLALIVTTGALLFLSPTGYPWYLYWAFVFIPFVPSYGLTVLSGLIALYYVRYAMGERGVYDLYSNLVVPLQFGIPLLIITFEVYKRRRHG